MRGDGEAAGLRGRRSRSGASTPSKTLIPTINVASATGWAVGTTPIPAPGTRVARFAEGLSHPRWVYVLPNGDVLVAESSAPPRPEDGKGIKGWFMKQFMKKAGSREQNAPLGRAVTGGLLLATFATLFLVPVVFSILRRKGAPRRGFEPQFESTGAGHPAR